MKIFSCEMRASLRNNGDEKECLDLSPSFLFFGWPDSMNCWSSSSSRQQKNASAQKRAAKRSFYCWTQHKRNELSKKSTIGE
jgi:hypothetical protein